MRSFKASLCTDCVMANAGYDEHELGHKFDKEPLSQLPANAAIGPDVDINDDRAYDQWSDGYFSWQPCDGCGSRLGGTRWDHEVVHDDPEPHISEVIANYLGAVQQAFPGTMDPRVRDRARHPNRKPDLY